MAFLEGTQKFKDCTRKHQPKLIEAATQRGVPAEVKLRGRGYVDLNWRSAAIGKW